MAIQDLKVNSLFSRLWRHCSKEAKPEENFFSELVAEAFRTHPELLYRWLDKIRVQDIPRAGSLEVTVQEHAEIAPDRSGFYDILIRIQHDAGVHLIVIESKLDCPLKREQLRDYQNELTNRMAKDPGVTATLICVTRDFENIDPPDGRAQFIQTRWESFYEILEDFLQANQSYLADQTYRFIREHHIATPVKITRPHLDALVNFGSCVQMLDAVFNSDIQNRFRELGGRMLTRPNQRIRSLLAGWLYGLRCHHGDWKLGFHLGFWHGYPARGVVYAGGIICLNGQTPEDTRTKMLSAARACLNGGSAWKPLDAPNYFATDPGFIWAQPLEDALAKANNADGVRGVLQPVLNSMRQFKDEFSFPGFRWDKDSQDELQGELSEGV